MGVEPDPAVGAVIAPVAAGAQIIGLVVVGSDVAQLALADLKPVEADALVREELVVRRDMGAFGVRVFGTAAFGMGLFYAEFIQHGRN